MSQRQTHPDVPTSDAPPIREWAGKYWYVITAAALQARPTLSDDEARLLVSFMESLQIALPCSECRGHYVADWALYPFTDAHARDPELAMQWVAALNARIEARKSAAKKLAAVPAVAPAPTSASVLTPPHTRTRAYASPALFARAGAGAGAGTAATRASASVPKVGSTAVQRSLALRASLMETRANIASGGTRGCTDCGKKKVQPLDAGVILGRSAIGSGSGAATKYRPLRR
jgi:hypothetical protein